MNVTDPLLEVQPGIPPYSATPTIVSTEESSKPDNQMPCDTQPSGILEAPKVTEAPPKVVTTPNAASTLSTIPAEVSTEIPRRNPARVRQPPVQYRDGGL